MDISAPVPDFDHLQSASDGHRNHDAPAPDLAQHVSLPGDNNVAPAPVAHETADGLQSPTNAPTSYPGDDNVAPAPVAHETADGLQSPANVLTSHPGDDYVAPAPAARYPFDLQTGILNLDKLQAPPAEKTHYIFDPKTGAMDPEFPTQPGTHSTYVDNPNHECEVRNVDDRRGWLDAGLGLNPSRSFTETLLEKVGGPESILRSKPGDSTAMTLARAGLNVVALPVWAGAVFVGHALDGINKFPAGPLGDAPRGPLPPEPMKGDDAPSPTEPNAKMG